VAVLRVVEGSGKRPFVSTFSVRSEASVRLVKSSVRLCHVCLCSVSEWREEARLVVSFGSARTYGNVASLTGVSPWRE